MGTYRFVLSYLLPTGQLVRFYSPTWGAGGALRDAPSPKKALEVLTEFYKGDDSLPDVLTNYCLDHRSGSSLAPTVLMIKLNAGAGDVETVRLSSDASISVMYASSDSEHPLHGRWYYDLALATDPFWEPMQSWARGIVEDDPAQVSPVHASFDLDDLDEFWATGRLGLSLPQY